MRKYVFCFMLLFLSNTTNAVVLTEQDAYTPVVVSVDEPVLLRLYENPTTGYLWQFEITDTNILQKQDGHFEPQNKNLIGAGGMREQTFLPQQAGQVIIRALYRRPWEKSGDRLLIYPVTVVSKLSR